MNKYSVQPFEVTYDSAPINESFAQYDIEKLQFTFFSDFKLGQNTSLIMSDSDEDSEWENVVDITHKVVNNMAGRGAAFASTLATVLKVNGDYEVYSVKKSLKTPKKHY